MPIIERIQSSIAEGKPFYSFEFFPPKTEVGLRNLYARIDRMAELNPAFVDITWGAGGSTSDLTLEISRVLQAYFGVEVMMHLTCTNMPRAKIDETLDKLGEIGVTNILALRGDPPLGQERWVAAEDGFSYASDLTRYIRERHGDHFGIGVAGYPEGHLESTSREDDVRHLKTKVDAGADFIITQLFYDLDEYSGFVSRCREAGIECPILPGVMPIYGYDRFKRFTEFCKTKIPQEIQDRLEDIRNDDAAVQAYGTELCTNTVKQLIAGGAPGVHFYTLNLESIVTTVVHDLGLVRSDPSRPVLPWRRSAHPLRGDEDVRPIFWSNRPKSYLARTQSWDAFPNGRWGPAASPAFGSMNDYYLVQNALKHGARRDKNRELWGAPKTAEEVRDVFVRFCRGEISRLPWSELGLRPESAVINHELLALNRAGILTVNSQPQVHAAPSDHSMFGWGAAGGRVFQRAYLEFFVAPERVEGLLEAIESNPSLSYMSGTKSGIGRTNVPTDFVAAVTWGVFPNSEVVQPTVVDRVSFHAWLDEAFEVWRREWSSLFDQESAEARTLNTIADTYVLVTLVENDFVDGDIFRPFRQLGYKGLSDQAASRPQRGPLGALG